MESNLHAEPPSDLKSMALTTRSPRYLFNLFKASLFLLAENALLYAKDNGVSE